MSNRTYFLPGGFRAFDHSTNDLYRLEVVRSDKPTLELSQDCTDCWTITRYWPQGETSRPGLHWGAVNRWLRFNGYPSLDTMLDTMEAYNV